MWDSRAGGFSRPGIAEDRKSLSIRDMRCVPDVVENSLNRIPLNLCLAAIVLPAQKRDGVHHGHGFLRGPLETLNVGL